MSQEQRYANCYPILGVSWRHQFEYVGADVLNVVNSPNRIDAFVRSTSPWTPYQTATRNVAQAIREFDAAFEGAWSPSSRRSEVQIGGRHWSSRRHWKSRHAFSWKGQRGALGAVQFEKLRRICVIMRRRPRARFLVASFPPEVRIKTNLDISQKMPRFPPLDSNRKPPSLSQRLRAMARSQELRGHLELWN